MEPVSYKTKFALLGAVLVPCFGQIALHGTGYEYDFQRYLVPFFVGAMAGGLIGFMKDKWLLSNKDLNATNAALENKIYEKNQVENALRESETTQRLLMENLPAGAIVVDPVTRTIESANEAAAVLFGASRHEIIGHRCHAYICPAEEGACPICDLEQEVDNSVREILCADGSRRPVLKSVKQIQILGQEKLLECFVDITERKQVEEALRESKEYQQSLFRAAPTGIGFVINRVFQQVNEQICEMTGYSEEELVGQSARLLYLNDEDFEYVGRETYKQISEHCTGTVETRWKQKDGRTIDVLLSSTPMDLNDLSKGVTFTALDITERKRAEEALRTFHEKFLTVLDSIDANVYVADMVTHEVLFMNKKMGEVFGRDMVGKLCWEVFRGASGPCRDCTNNQLLDEKGMPAEVCTWHGRNPITGKWYINHDRAIEWADGRLVRLQVATDITDLKLMEQQVQQSQKFEAIGTLAGGIAHDFNNLLMGIQGRISLLAGELKSHSAREHTHAIEDYVRSATDLTNQLLGLARGGKYQVKPIDLNALIRSSANMFGRTKKEIRIYTEIDDAPLSVEVDQGQIEQVLLNLYVNAWQAMPEGGELHLATQIVTLDDYYVKAYNAKPGRYAKASIADTGIGMEKNIQQQVFDPFFTTKEKGRGTGLGLASAYGIIKNHDGVITVDSKVGHGTTFAIYLPLSDKMPPQEVPAYEALINGTEKLLLVDDEAMILEVAQAMLERLGYQVLTADSGQEALNVIHKSDAEIDLVILDLIMPDLDGGKVFDQIKEIHPEIPILLSSGYAINGQANAIMQRGCNGFIQKPFNIAALSQKVREVLDGAKKQLKDSGNKKDDS